VRGNFEIPYNKLARLKASHYILVLRSANLSGSPKKEIPMHFNYRFSPLSSILPLQGGGDSLFILLYSKEF